VGSHRETCRNFPGACCTPGVKTAAKHPPGSHWKELVEGTQRKAGLFTFPINNLRAKEAVSLLKVWKGDGTFTRISFRAFLGEGWRVTVHMGAVCSYP